MSESCYDDVTAPPNVIFGPKMIARASRNSTKTGTPMHPIVSKYLDTWFKATTNFQSRRSLKNYIELFRYFCLTTPFGSILISFDIVGLFFNVLLIPTHGRMVEILREETAPLSSINEFTSLLNQCLSHDVCQFGNP